MVCCNARVSVFDRMRDLLTTEKQERQQLQKQCDKQQTEIANLQRDKERLSSQVTELENQVIELKEQVSSSEHADHKHAYQQTRLA